jgi:hypothetical protein
LRRGADAMTNRQSSEPDGHVLKLTANRPQYRNAQSRHLLEISTTHSGVQPKIRRCV